MAINCCKNKINKQLSIFLAFHLFYFLSHSQENVKNHGFIEKKEERRAISSPFCHKD